MKQKIIFLIILCAIIFIYSFKGLTYTIETIICIPQPNTEKRTEKVYRNYGYNFGFYFDYKNKETAPLIYKDADSIFRIKQENKHVLDLWIYNRIKKELVLIKDNEKVNIKVIINSNSHSWGIGKKAIRKDIINNELNNILKKVFEDQENCL